MVYSTIVQLEIELADKYLPALNSTSANNSSIGALNQVNDMHDLKVKIATALCFWCGCIQVYGFK